MTHTLRTLLAPLADATITAIPEGKDRAEALEMPVREVCYDSRRANEGSLFVCLRGTQTDGHEYARAAYDNGTRAFLAEHTPALPPDATVVCVPDSRAALADVAAAFYQYPAEQMRLIGITGTKGKTTTACLIAHILNTCGIPTGYIGTNGAEFAGIHLPTANSTPESMEIERLLRRMLDAGVRTCVMEVSSQGLWMGRVRGLSFTAGLFTNLSPDHIGGVEHPDLDHYRACKRRLFSDHPMGAAFCNADDPEADYMTAGCRVPPIRFSVSDEPSAPGDEPDWRATAIRQARQDGRPGMAFRVTGCGGAADCFLPLPGIFNVSNALGALAVCCECFPVALSDATYALADAHVPGRFELILHPAQPDVTYIVDYAHNGLSLASILDTLRGYAPARLICLFGSVGERTRGRRAELAMAASGRADLCILTSDNPGRESPEDIIREIDAAFPVGSCPRLCIPDRAEAIRTAVRLARPGDMILLSGKGHETYQLIGTDRVPFSERDILKEELDIIFRARRL